MRRRHWLPMVLAGAGGLVGGGLIQHLWQQPTEAKAQLPMAPARIDDVPAKPSGDDFEPAVQKVMPSLVAVEATKTSGRIKPLEESGSGVLMKFEGFRGVFAVTNNHVVEGAKATEITVTLFDGRILTPDRVWTDPASDIAILRLDAENLPAAELGDSDKVKPGHWVLAYGSPLGFSQTVTHGIISARDRGQVTLNNTIRIKEFLQSDAAINPGSSGGPLSDRSGKIIGINTAIASGGNANSTFAGISFSIPINLVKRLGREMLDKGTVQRGYLGLQMSNALDAKMALKLGLTKLRGAMIEAPHKGGPGERAGLQAGDVIQKVDGLEIRDENQFINIVGALPVGESLKLTVWRNKQTKEVTLTLTDWPARK